MIIAFETAESNTGIVTSLKVTAKGTTSKLILCKKFRAPS